MSDVDRRLYAHDHDGMVQDDKYGEWYHESAVRELVEALAKCKRLHYYCDDCWYTCPAHPEGSCNDDKKGAVCNCGADEWNAKIDDLLTHYKGLTDE